MAGPDYLAMDPNILYSIANTKLRNDHRGLDELAIGLDLSPEALTQRLGQAGFVYDAAHNQFRPKGAV